jgi:hypothetical protein
MAVVIYRILCFVYLGWVCTLYYRAFHPSSRSPWRVAKDTGQGIRQRIRNKRTSYSPRRTERLINRLRDYKCQTNGDLPEDPGFWKQYRNLFPKSTAQADKLVLEKGTELVHLRACLTQLVEAEDYETAAQVRDYIDELTGFQLYRYRTR